MLVCVHVFQCFFVPTPTNTRHSNIIHTLVTCLNETHEAHTGTHIHANTHTHKHTQGTCTYNSSLTWGSTSHQGKTKEWQPLQNWFRPQNLSKAIKQRQAGSNQTETSGEEEVALCVCVGGVRVGARAQPDLIPFNLHAANL